MKILVTGYPGQLAMCVADCLKERNIDYDALSIGEFDITNKDDVFNRLEYGRYDYLINCAAYTNVDAAEDDMDNALKVNDAAVMLLAKACEENNITLIHISTDYVFKGDSVFHKTEDDKRSPINMYGKTKALGEINIEEVAGNHKLKYMIIRTAWLYSEYGNNFVKTILRKLAEGEVVNVVNDQYGSPTYARDLADFIVNSVIGNEFESGIYHYTNEGSCSWYDFTVAIATNYNKVCQEINLPVAAPVNPIRTQDLKQKAIRPPFVVLSKDKVKKVFNIKIPHWSESLEKMMSRYISL